MSNGTFPFDPEAFLVGTADMTAEQVGGYIRLLCYQWEKGGLPDDIKAIERLAGISHPDAVAIIGGKFTRYADGKLRNKRLEKDRRIIQGRHEIQAGNAKKRWERYPTADDSKAIADLFGRRYTTKWAEKEVVQFMAIRKSITLSDLGLVARYYAAERAKGDEGIQRRDLCTFLNNYLGELDRARQWEASKGRKSANLNGTHTPAAEPPGFRDWLARAYPDRADAAFAECQSLLPDFRRAMK